MVESLEKSFGEVISSTETKSSCGKHIFGGGRDGGDAHASNAAQDARSFF